MGTMRCMGTSSGDELRCQGLNFAGADLSRLDLRHINFKMANLAGANLSMCNLEYVNFENADLRGANLEGANLNGSCFARSNCNEARFVRCNFFTESAANNAPGGRRTTPDQRAAHNAHNGPFGQWWVDQHGAWRELLGSAV